MEGKGTQWRKFSRRYTHLINSELDMCIEKLKGGVTQYEYNKAMADFKYRKDEVIREMNQVVEPACRIIDKDYYIGNEKVVIRVTQGYADNPYGFNKQKKQQ